MAEMPKVNVMLEFERAPIKVKFLQMRAHAITPTRATPGSAGYDLYLVEPVVLQPGERQLCPLGFGLEIPHGYEAQIRPRSGLALREGVTVLNSPSTIDSDYRGEIGVILYHTGSTTRPAWFAAKAGDRIAQLVFAPVETADWEYVEELSTTERGAGGFGSTGKGSK